MSAVDDPIGWSESEPVCLCPFDRRNCRVHALPRSHVRVTPTPYDWMREEDPQR